VQCTTAAARVLASVAVNSNDDNTKLRFAQAILDRGWGKPDQHVDAKTQVPIETLLVQPRVQPKTRMVCQK